MKLKTLIAAAIISVLGVGLVGSASALDIQPAETPSSGREDGTFSTSMIGDDAAEFRFGSNIFLAGNFVDGDKTSQPRIINGILCVAGNQVDTRHESEYTFLAGNTINYEGETEKDLFAAGNTVNISSKAYIGRDAFIGGNAVKFEADLVGDLSVGANKLVLKDVYIDGDVNLDVETISFEGKVKITGKLSFNDDADVIGLSNATYGELEKYVHVKYEPTPSEILFSKIMSIGGLFIVMAIFMAMFPGLDKRMHKELNLTQFGKDLVVGLCTMFFVPVIVIALLLSSVGAPAGLILLVVYIISMYLSQGFTGYYLGKAIFEKMLNNKMNKFVEALTGVAIITLCAWLVPMVWFLAAILGFGLIMQSIKPNREPKTTSDAATPTPTQKIDETKVAEAVVAPTKAESKTSSTKNTKDAKETKASKTTNDESRSKEDKTSSDEGKEVKETD